MLCCYLFTRPKPALKWLNIFVVVSSIQAQSLFTRCQIPTKTRVQVAFLSLSPILVFHKWDMDHFIRCYSRFRRSLWYRTRYTTITCWYVKHTDCDNRNWPCGTEKSPRSVASLNNISLDHFDRDVSHSTF